MFSNSRKPGMPVRIWTHCTKHFSKKEGSNFRKVFRKNIAIMYPYWFIPLGSGIYLLCNRYSRDVLMIFVAFIIVSFLMIPAISRFVGCKGCNLKEQCPWMGSETTGGSDQVSFFRKNSTTTGRGKKLRLATAARMVRSTFNNMGMIN
jgi:hypothetical protein